MDTTPAAHPEEVKVLVVDDHWQNLVAMTATLEPLRCRVVTAGSGEEALAAVLRDDFAVILLDVRMHGIDGFETARLIREREASRHTPVIFLTAASGEMGFVEKGYSLGAVDYLVKPVAPDVVRAKVAVFVDIRRKAQILRRNEEKLLEDVRRRNEIALRETAAEYEATLAEAPFGVAQATLDGRWVRVNQHLCDVLDASKDRLVGRHFLEMVHPHDARPVVDAIARTAGGQLSPYRAECRFVCASGRIVWVNLTVCALRDAAGKTKQLITVLEDITDRKRSEEGQRFLAEASEVLLSSLDQQTILERVAHLTIPLLGDACLVHFTYDEEVAALAPIAAYMQPSYAAGVDSLVAEVLAEHPTEAFVEREGGQSVLVLPLRARNRVLGTITFVTVSEHRRNPAELRVATDLAHRVAFAVENARLYVEAQRAIRARDDFLSIASHELRTPLTPLQLQLQRLIDRRHGDLDIPQDRLRTILERSERQVQRLALLIDNLLDVSRIGSGKLKLNPEVFDLSALVRDVAGRFGDETARTQCVLEVIAKQRAVGAWDRLRIEQVVTNLLANAFKYGAGKPIYVQVDVHGDSAQLVIRDHGIGIHEADVNRIFARFERAVSSRAYGGLGLGLYIARQIVVRTAGSIRVDSKVGTGSHLHRFTPTARAPVMAAILLVEDDADIRLTIGELLEEEGYSVTTAANGFEALEQLRRARPLPHLILLDLMMPGMDGVQFRLEQLKLSECAGIPLVVLSADGHTREVARDLGASGCLRKPVDLGDLLETLRRVCAS